MLAKVAKHLGIQTKEIGYAGLKDKHAMTTQYISVHKKFEEQIDAMSIEGVKVLEKQYHDNKIKTGHLKGNRFFIRLKKVSKADAKKIQQALKNLEKGGMPNYFGFQRFGNDGDNYKEGEAICRGQKKERNKKLQRLYINAYQSHLFNNWLDARLTFVHNARANGEGYVKGDTPLGVMEGDIAMHYPFGRAFKVEDPDSDAKRVDEKDIVISGLLAGKRAIRSEGVAYEIESEFDQETPVNGERRYAWVYPTQTESEYKPQEGWMELHFTLPKGSYATVLIEQIAKQPIEKLTEGIE